MIGGEPSLNTGRFTVAVTIPITINQGGVPDCPRETAKEDEEVEWVCNEVTVTACRVLFNKGDGNPLDGGDPSNSSPKRKVKTGASHGQPRRRYNYRVCATTAAHGEKCKDPPLDIVPGS